MRAPVAVGEPRKWTIHSPTTPQPGELWGTARHVFLLLDARELEPRFQTDHRPGYTRWKVTVVPIDRNTAHDHTIYETTPCRIDGTPR